MPEITTLHGENMWHDLGYTKRSHGEVCDWLGLEVGEAI